MGRVRVTFVSGLESLEGLQRALSVSIPTIVHILKCHTVIEFH